MDVIGKNVRSATLFVSGKFWKGGDTTKQLAKRLGFAVMYESGEDLTVSLP